jgi:hypothetical protein
VAELMKQGRKYISMGHQENQAEEIFLEAFSK